jgi:peptidoglycan/xylan/chitin deacetylase (PgdA/CDA1 family)
VKAALLERVASRPVVIGPQQSIVSFTFDDVPLSAWSNAVPVLDRHELKATFYVALRMAAPGDGFLGEEHVRALAQNQHQIGCHTLTHYSLQQGSAEGLYEDARAGKQALEALTAGLPADHFAYPFGAVSPRAKRMLQKLFATMRTSTRGVNSGRVDLNYLRAEHLYSRGAGLDMDRIRRRVRSVVERGGWLILYTHGVTDDPGPYDTSCADFRGVVEVVTQSGARVLPVSEALASIKSA